MKWGWNWTQRGANLRELECVRGKKRSWNSTTEVVILHRPAIKVSALRNSLQSGSLAVQSGLNLRNDLLTAKPLIRTMEGLIVITLWDIVFNLHCEKLVSRIEMDQSQQMLQVDYETWRSPSLIKKKCINRWRWWGLTIHSNGSRMPTSLLARHLDCCSAGAWDLLNN